MSRYIDDMAGEERCGESGDGLMCLFEDKDEEMDNESVNVDLDEHGYKKEENSEEENIESCHADYFAANLKFEEQKEKDTVLDLVAAQLESVQKKTREKKVASPIPCKVFGRAEPDHFNFFIGGSQAKYLKAVLESLTSSKGFRNGDAKAGEHVTLTLVPAGYLRCFSHAGVFKGQGHDGEGDSESFSYLHVTIFVRNCWGSVLIKCDNDIYLDGETAELLQKMKAMRRENMTEDEEEEYESLVEKSGLRFAVPVGRFQKVVGSLCSGSGGGWSKMKKPGGSPDDLFELMFDVTKNKQIVVSKEHSGSLVAHTIAQFVSQQGLSVTMGPEPKYLAKYSRKGPGKHLYFTPPLGSGCGDGDLAFATRKGFIGVEDSASEGSRGELNVALLTGVDGQQYVTFDAKDPTGVTSSSKCIRVFTYGDTAFTSKAKRVMGNSGLTRDQRDAVFGRSKHLREAMFTLQGFTIKAISAINPFADLVCVSYALEEGHRIPQTVRLSSISIEGGCYAHIHVSTIVDDDDDNGARFDETMRRKRKTLGKNMRMNIRRKKKKIN